MISNLSEIKDLEINTPEGAFYSFPNISKYINKSYKNYLIQICQDISMYLLEDAGVSTVSGSAFGTENYIRISYAASELELKNACISLRNKKPPSRCFEELFQKAKFDTCLEKISNFALITTSKTTSEIYNSKTCSVRKKQTGSFEHNLQKHRNKTCPM